MQRVIGIDFGTSTTYMNVKRYNGSQPVEDKSTYIPVKFNFGESHGCVASIARENADGSFDFGESAGEQLEGSVIHTAVKMRLESPDEAERAEARRVTRAFFKFLYETYAQQAGLLGDSDDLEETLISYPVKWQKETAEFMLDAARSAGFQNVRGMDEAEAAVTAVLCQNTDGKGLIYANKPGYLLLIDMGAGTTDLVVCRYQTGDDQTLNMELVTSWPHSAGEPTFGGREIDDLLERYIEDYLMSAMKPEMAPMAHTIAAAPGQAKQWKERNVSVTLQGDQSVTTCGYISGYKPFLAKTFPSFGRKEFESMAQSGLQDYARLLEGCLAETAKRDPRFTETGLDLVVLTGGHSAWYFAREMVDGTMEGWLDHPALAAVRENPYRVVALPNPQTTVSLGLVYSKLPYTLAKAEPPKEEVTPPVEDVNPHEEDLGTEPEPEKGPEISSPVTDLDFSMRLEQHTGPSGQDLMVTGEILFGRIAVGEAVTLVGVDSMTESLLSQDTFEPKTKIALLRSRGMFSRTNSEVTCILSGSDAVQEAKAGQRVSITLANLAGFSMPKAPYLVSLLDGFPTEDQSEGTLPPEDTAPTGKETYQWDDRLLPVAKNIIQNAPDFQKTNLVYYSTAFNEMRAHFGLHPNEEVLHICPTGSDTRRGHIITNKGIYWKYKTTPSVNFLSWEMFLNSKTDVKTPDLAASLSLFQLTYKYKLRKVVTNEQNIKTGMYKLYLTLREKSAALFGSAGGGHPYHWDERLLSAVRQFVNSDAVISGRNQLHKENMDKLAPKLGLHEFAEFYYVATCGKNKKAKALIYSTGIGVRQAGGLFSSYGPPIVTWEQFLQGTPGDPGSELGQLVWYEMQLGQSMVQLQAFLRKKHDELEDLCPL